MMKLRYLPCLLLLLAFLTPAAAAESGRGLALQLRAASIIRQKNDFIARVLTSYAIPYERNEEGAVVRLVRDGRPVDITKIEVVPLLKEATDKKQHVGAHELLFYTSQGVLSLVSELAIR